MSVPAPVMPELTICSVSYHSAPFLRLNESLTRRLNPGARLHWIVAENSPADSARRLGEQDQAFELLPGAGPGHIATYHHTLALRSCTDRSSTRFVAVIDPDLFVVRPGWVVEMIEHMKREHLAFIGVPWHPQSQGKYRYFPAVHFTLFDTGRFRRDDIDFLPDYPDGEADPAWSSGWTLESNFFVRSPIVRILAKLPMAAPRRQYYTDTGSRFFKRWVDERQTPHETLVPRWREPAPATSVLRRAVQALMPDELSYVPKHYPEATFRTSADLAAAAQALPAHWECFEWHQELFCVHVRGNLDRSARNTDSELDIATRLADAACSAAAV